MATSRVGTAAVQVTGLEETLIALRAQGPEMRKELRSADAEVATHEAAHAKSAAAGMGGVAAKAAPSVQATIGYASAGVDIDASSYPYAFGAAFGGQGRPTTMQFPPWVKGGYFPFPQIEQDQPLIAETYLRHADAVLKRLYPDGV